eukprot:TRINITY_DN7521_c0_g1_i1.p1 TRINITY_DN7521_c0_g1~~TRINITY_DN7521_c0_g1_i1.p1  ORF type:complete len:2724 (+),score=384.89 TRINITY_DN7521_c0_g1_i1:801-8174(+)
MVQNAPEFMLPHLRDTCETVLSFKDHKNILLRNEVIVLLAPLARFHPDAFSHFYLEPTVSHLLNVLNAQHTSRPERAAAWSTIGQIALAMHHRIAPHLNGIMGALESALSPRRVKDRPPEAYTALSNLVKACIGFDGNMRQRVSNLLQPLFAAPVTTELGQTLTDITAAIPALLQPVQERLLEAIRQVLTNNVASSQTDDRKGRESKDAGSTASDIVAEKHMALVTLGNFNMQGHRLSHYVEHTVLAYLRDPNPLLRKAAAKTCCKLLCCDTDPSCAPKCERTLLPRIVCNLLAVAVSDSDSDIRHAVLLSLDCRFDAYLATPQCLRLLFISLNDEVFANRELSIDTIGRLTKRNPSFILNHFRSVLLQLINELEFTVDSRKLEESGKMLGKVIRAAPGLIPPYAPRILEVLVARLRENSPPAVTATLLFTLGELSGVCGKQLRDTAKLLELVVDILMDQSSWVKRIHALRAIGSIVVSTGNVITPYIEYPQLLPFQLKALQADQKVEWESRREVMKLLGIVGAIDPYQHKRVQVDLQGSERTAENPKSSAAAGLGHLVKVDTIPMRPSANMDDYYPTVVINLLLSLLNDDTVAEYHQLAISGFVPIFKSLGINRSLQYLPHVVPKLLHLCKTLAPLREFLIGQLTALTTYVKGHIVSYLPEILRLVREFFLTPDELVLLQVITLVEELKIAFNEDFAQYLPWLVPTLVHVAARDDSDSRKLAMKCFHCFEVLGEALRDYLDFIIPCLADAIADCQMDTSAIFQYRAVSCCTLTFLSTLLDLRHHVSRIIPPLLRAVTETNAALLESSASSPTSATTPSSTSSPITFGAASASVTAIATLHVEACNLLCAMVINMGTDFLRHVPQLRMVFGVHRVVVPAFDQLVTTLQQKGAGSLAPLKDVHAGNMQNISALVPGVQLLLKPPGVAHLPSSLPAVPEEPNPEDVRRCPIDTSHLAQFNVVPVTEEDWVKWLNLLSLELIKQSPSHAIRHCYQLAQIYPPLARELFSVAFVCCYNNLRDDMQVNLLRTLNQALLAKSCPIQVLQTLLNFAEFLGRDVTLNGGGATLFADEVARRLEDPEGQASGNLSPRRAPASALSPRPPQSPKSPVGSPASAFQAPPSLKAQEIFDISLLARSAEKCHLYAKALRYKELEFHTMVQQFRATHSKPRHLMNPTELSAANLTEQPERWQRICEQLINISHKMDLPETAAGVVRFCEAHVNLVKISALEDILQEGGEVLGKLNRWEDALRVYQRKLQQEPNNMDHLLGVLRSLRALGEWSKQWQICDERWKTADEFTRGQLAPHAAHASWMLSRWPFLSKALAYIDKTNPAYHFYAAVIDVHSATFPSALEHIEQARKLMAPAVSAFASESYDRAYYSIVQLQHLSELEEVISYKTNAEAKDKTQLRLVWQSRLAGIQRNVQYWEEVLAVQSLVCQPHENIDSWLNFSQLCLESGKPRAAQRTLINLLSPEFIRLYSENAFTPSMLLNSSTASPKVIKAFFEHMWKVGERQEAYAMLAEFVSRSTPNQQTHPELAQLRASCYSRLAEWQQQLHKDTYSADRKRSAVLHNLQLATQLDPLSHEAWHGLALFNQKVAERLRKMKVDSETILPYLVTAIRGFVQSISLSSRQLDVSIQDILRLLTIWFNYGEIPQVAQEVQLGLPRISIDAWLLVIPQLIARMQSSIPAVSEGVINLLIRLGEAHPQALIYPVTVAAKPHGPFSILEAMKAHSPSLVNQASLVSDELLRVAILWTDQWFEGLEEACKYYFVEQNEEAMMAVLEPLHEMLDTAQTEHEKAFQAAYGPDLQEALNWCKAYKLSHKTPDLNKAWDLYYHAFRKLNKQLQSMRLLELQAVSPSLLDSRNLELAVPGQYRAGEQPPRIAGFAPSVEVISSKQRPRKLTMNGSDGNDYTFLLKGHEDLRQDERVMQLFGLVNTLLAGDTTTSRRDLNIEKYPVIPLSNNVGLIGWLEHAETLHQLVQEYRHGHKMHLNTEHRLMLQMAGDYDNLMEMQKVEVFEFAMDNTDGQDLNKVLWLRSPSSEVWLDCRTCYSRSLATMSMVGYILGLGDRHPSNVMLQKHTGKVVHIDFGDCFEVAMHREKFPERVPFRLTRMLVHAMEACGIEGTFLHTCERVMKVLRKNRDSLMAMLEAFVYDPLIAWRLAGTQPRKPPPPACKQGENIYAAFEAQQQSSSYCKSSLTSRSTRERELYSASLITGPQQINRKALEVVTRIKRKLEGTEFAPLVPLSRKRAVDSPVQQPSRAQPVATAPPPVPEVPVPASAVPPALKSPALKPRDCDSPAARSDFTGPGSVASTATLDDPSSGDEASDQTPASVSLRLQRADPDDSDDGQYHENFSDEDSSGEEDGAQSDPDLPQMPEGQPPPETQSHSRRQSHNRRRDANTPQPAVSASALDEDGTSRLQYMDDDANPQGLSVADQVQRLIRQATSHQNLCQCYIGWCPFW